MPVSDPGHDRGAVVPPGALTTVWPCPPDSPGERLSGNEPVGRMTRRAEHGAGERVLQPVERASHR